MGPFQTSRVNYLAHTHDNLFERVLSFLFPVALPKVVEQPGDIHVIEEQGSCGQARRRQYRDAIDRHWKTVEVKR
jgi:hypothetical protein